MAHADTDQLSATKLPQGTETPSIFISYAREDSAFVERLRESLSQNGIETRGDWLLSPGERYEEQLRSLVIGTDAFAFVISPGSLASTACKKELDLAYEQRKRILPVSHQEHGEDTSLPPALRDPQWTLLRDSDDIAVGTQDSCFGARSEIGIYRGVPRQPLSLNEFYLRTRHSCLLFRRFPRCLSLVSHLCIVHAATLTRATRPHAPPRRPQGAPKAPMAGKRAACDNSLNNGN